MEFTPFSLFGPSFFHVFPVSVLSRTGVSCFVLQRAAMQTAVSCQCLQHLRKIHPFGFVTAMTISLFGPSHLTSFACGVV